METTLSLSLRNFILDNKIPSAFIDFDEFYHSERYDGIRSLPKGCQALILRKPEPAMFEIEPFLNWPYPADKVLLVHHSSSKEVAFIPLSFSHKFSGRDKDCQFDFSHYHSIKICEGHILITANGKEVESSSDCLNIALFTQKGELVSVWETWNANNYKSRVSNFHQLNSDHWIVNLSIDEQKKYKPAVRRLYLLPVHNIKAYTLSTEKEWDSQIGSLLDTKTEKIESWFSPEIVENEPEFLVIASSYQCCVHRYEGGGNYVELVDTVFDSSLFGNLQATFGENKLEIFSSTKIGNGIWKFELNF